MKPILIDAGTVADGFFDGAVARILELQRTNGAIPWYDDGVIDPWNHTEAAMGLTVMKEWEHARRAFRFLADSQLADGSWWAQYGAAVPLDDNRYNGDGDSEKRLRDTNFCAYPAVGIWHYYLCTDDLDFLKEYWPVVRDATDWVLSFQSEHGEIRWAARDTGTPEDDALVTGCSSIYKSLSAAYAVSRAAGEARSDWLTARDRLGHALRHKPERFDRQWAKKDGFSMDWYYPVLTGVLQGSAAHARLASRWDEFVADGLGCRCVIDQPWVTIAESCELVLALIACGQTARARDLFSWQHQWRDEAGAYWMGYQFEANVFWPDEKPAWTAGAVILAADALLGLSPARHVLSRPATDAVESATT